jgi:hypothetical protein
VIPAQLAYIEEDLDKWFGDWPIEVCLHDIATGLSYWPIKHVESWDELEDLLTVDSSRCLISYKWSTRKRWRVLRVGWWTSDDVLSRLKGAGLPQAGGIGWPAVQALSASDVCRRYPGGGLRMYLGRCAKGHRSDVIYRLARTLIERGASNEEVACVVVASGAYKSRCDEYGERSQRRSLEALCKKLRNGR